jgi:hypothetical protein
LIEIAHRPGEHAEDENADPVATRAGCSCCHGGKY